MFMEEIEIWKDVITYEGWYQVSSFGNVRTFRAKGRGVSNTQMKEPRLLKPFKDRGGYVNVKLTKDKIEKTIMIHRLVATAFLENPNNLEQVNHIDSNRSNNNVSNLEWVSREENQAHGYLKRNFSSKYLGVSFKKDKNRWDAVVHKNGVSKYIGRFKTELEAYCAVKKYREEHGLVNKYFINEEAPSTQ